MTFVFIIYREFANAMVTCNKPILVAVNGKAHGLGMSLNLLGDLVYAYSEATFDCPFADIGQSPEGRGVSALPCPN